jgi:HD-GYP domain-containing protein (c-di-GMP phosphodiesterase class II)
VKPEALLGRVAIFRGLEPEDCARLAEALVEQSYAPGQVVLAAEDACESLILVGEGRLVARASGKTFEPGDALVELAALSEQPNPHGAVVAEEAARCYVLQPRALYDQVRASPSLAAGLVQSLASQLTAGGSPGVPSGSSLDEQLAIYVRDFRQLFQQERERANELQNALLGIVRALVSVCEMKDPALSGHGSRVGRYAQVVARLLGWPNDRLGDAGLGGLLHDVGNIAIDSTILLKRGTLSGEEWALIHRHPEIGASIVKEIPPLRQLVPYIQAHHERWDGRGFPSRLSGTRIPIEGRLVAVVDSFDTLVSRLPSRDARAIGLAVAEIRGQSATAFDPAVVDAFYRAIRLGEITVASG